MLQAALRAAPRDRRSVFELFPRRLPDGPPVRRGGRRRAGARRPRALRFDEPDAGLPRASAASSTTRRSAWLADYRSPATSGATPRARSTSRTRRCMVVESTFAEAVLLETLLLSILNHDSAIASAGLADDLGRRRPPLHRDGHPPHPRGGGRRRGPRRRTSRGFAATSNLAAGRRLRHPDDGHQRPQLHAAARHRARRLHRAGRVARARAPRCWSTPTTSPRRCGSAWRSPGPSSARCGSTPATSGCSPSRCGPSSTRSAPSRPGSW